MKSFLTHFKQTVFIIILFFISLIVAFYFTIQSIDKYSIKIFEESELSNFKKVIDTKVNFIGKTINKTITDSIANERENKKRVLNNIYNIVLSVYKTSQKSGYNDIFTKQLIKDVLSEYRFSDKQEYFYIENINGVVELNPAFPQKVGSNILIYTDCNGRYFAKDIINQALRYGKGWVKYCWQDTPTGKATQQETFFKLFKPFNWIIGVTFNYEIFYNKLKNKILKSVMRERIPEFGGIIVFDNNHRPLITNSELKHIDYKTVLTSGNYLFNTFKIKRFSWEICYFLDKNIILQGIRKGEKVFTEIFLKRLYVFIFVIITVLLLLIRYFIKITQNYNDEIKKLNLGIKNRDTNKTINKIKEFHEIYMTFSEVLRELENEQTNLNRLFTVSENAPFSILITDKKRKIIYANPFMLEHYGYTFKELEGKSPKIFGTDYNAKFYDDLENKIKNEKFYEVVFLNKKKNKTEFWEHVYIVPVKDKNGEIVNYIAYKEDITAKKLMEEKLIQSKEEAEKFAQMKTNFLANISHEMRTPLNGIIGFVDLLLESETDNEKIKYLNIVKDSSNTLLEIINNILDLTKIEESKEFKFEIVSFDVKNVILKCIDKHKTDAMKKDIKLLYEIDNNIPEHLKGDRERILQVLDNLTGNAIKFTEKGYVKIYVKKLYESSGTVTLKFSVEDTGIGIDKDKLNGIFDAFFQADTSTTRKYGGSGLGLAISKKIIDNLGGKLEVESTLGKGSKFYFTLDLPIGDDVIISTSKEHYQKEINLSFITAIVVTSDIFNREYFTKIFKKFNINFEFVSKGNKLLETMQHTDFDIIFIETDTPESDWKDTVTTIRKLENGETTDNFDCEKFKGKNNILVAIIGDTDNKTVNELKQAGINDIITKPLNSNDVISIIKKYSETKKFSIEDIINMEELSALVDYDNDIREQLISSFVKTCKEIVEEFSKAISDKKFSELSIIIGKLKGVAGNIKANVIYNLALDMEQALKKNNIKEFETHYNYLKNIFNKIKQ